MANIKVYNPDGQMGEIPEEELELAQQQGYTPVENIETQDQPIVEESPIENEPFVRQPETGNIYVIDENGDFGSIEEENFDPEIFRPATNEEYQQQLEAKKYNTTTEQVKTFAEGALEGTTAGIGNALLEKTGIIDEEAAKNEKNTTQI